MSKVIGYVINSLRDTLSNEDERKKFFDEFCQRHGIDRKTKLTPELRKKLADEMTDHIMGKAQRMKGGGNG